MERPNSSRAQSMAPIAMTSFTATKASKPGASLISARNAAMPLS
jgi:hypothetical protein